MKIIIGIERTPQEKAAAKTYIWTELPKNFSIPSGVNQSVYIKNERKNALENVYSSVRS
jgi:hypothetical protein